MKGGEIARWGKIRKIRMKRKRDRQGKNDERETGKNDLQSRKRDGQGKNDAPLDTKA